MEEEKNIVEQNKKNNTNIILVIAVAVVVLVLIVLGLTAMIFINKNKDNKDTENSNSNVEVNLTKEELKKLIEKNYYVVGDEGKDIVSEGKFDDEVRLKLALNNYLHSDDVVTKTVDSEIVLKNNSDFTYYEEEAYKLKDDPYDMLYLSDETDYYPYEGVNKYYKELFNTDAPKTKASFDSYTHYYYSPEIDGYVYIVIGRCAISYAINQIYEVKDYKVENNQLIVSVYHTTFERIYDDDVTAVMKNDKNLKYKIASSEDEKAMKDDMLNNHADKMDIYNFIFDIVDNNYYLSDIKKA